MPQALAVAIITGLFTLTAAVLGLAGVLVKCWLDFSSGKRSADAAQKAVGVQAQAVGVQQEALDLARIEKLVKETEELRAEIRQLWEANRQIRHDFESSEKRHEEEKQSMRVECSNLTRRAESAEKDRDQAVRLKERAEAERDFALAAQERAEGGLKSAQKTIADLCPRD